MISPLLVFSLLSGTFQVADAVQSFCVPRCGASRLTQMWVAGGGVHNHTLMAALQTALPDMTVAPFDGAREPASWEKKGQEAKSKTPLGFIPLAA